jgi:hypothetical protein
VILDYLEHLWNTIFTENSLVLAMAGEYHARCVIWDTLRLIIDAAMCHMIDIDQEDARRWLIVPEVRER